MISRKLSMLLALSFVLLAPRLTLATPEDHVFYLGTNNHVYDIWYETGQTNITIWDATQLAGAPVAAQGSGLASYFIDNEEFVYYVTTSDHIGLLYQLNDVWHFDDLSTLAGAPAPIIGTTPLVGFKNGATPYVFYQYGTSPCLAEVYGTGSNTWAWDSPSTLAGAPACESHTPLTAFLINSERLIYYSDGSDVHELYNNGAGWVHVNITQAAGAPAMLSNSALAGFSYGLQSHIYYVASGGEVYQLYENDGSAWSYTNLTAVSGAPASEVLKTEPPLIPLTSYSYDSYYHLLYATPDGSGYGLIYDIYAPVNTESWIYQEASVGAMAIQPGPMAGYNNTGSNTQHVWFVGPDSCVTQSQSNVGSNSWLGTDAYCTAPAVASTSQLAATFF